MKTFTNLILLSFLIVSCSEDDEVDLITPLVGSWEFFSIITTNCADSADEGTFICEDTPCYELTIRDDPDFSFNNHVDGISTDGELRITATTLQFCDENNVNCNPEVEYTLNDDLLTIVTYWPDRDCDIIVVYNKR